MSNTPTYLTQFQQKAQLRLQEMDVEWRRTLFERFREICREEMLDVMKSLLSTMNSPEALAQKLEEMSAASHIAQDGLHDMLEQTRKEVQLLAEQVKAPPPVSVDTKELEELTKESRTRQEQLFTQTMRQQENSAAQIKEEVRQGSDSSRRTVIWMMILAVVLTILICAATVFSMKFFGSAALLTQTDIEGVKMRETEMAMLEAKVQALVAQKSELEKEFQQLTARREALQVELRQSAEMQSAATANLTVLQQQLTKLRALEEQFRFKMVKGETGGVFVEIPADAKPFEHQGQTFIQMK